MHKETNFEDAIEEVLIAEGGYTKGNPDDYDRDRALFPKDILAFVQQTQPKFWERFSQMNQGKAAEILLDSLVKNSRAKECSPFCGVASNALAKPCALPTLPPTQA